MKVDPRGIVYALTRAVREGNRGMVDQLSEEIIAALVRLDAIEAKASITTARSIPEATGK